MSEPSLIGRMIFVHCDDPESHPGRVARLEIFSRNAEGEWHSLPQRAKPAQRKPGRMERHAVTYLDGSDTPGHDPELYADLPREPLRRRYEIECPLCGRRTVARADTLEAILEVVAARTDDGPVSLPLRWLAAKMSSK